MTEADEAATKQGEVMPAEQLGPPDGSASTTALATSHHTATMNPAAGRPLLSVAPMMDWTDVHFRQLARLLSRRTWLWTEMVVDKTIIHTQNLDKYLWFPPEQRPLVLQLGGSDPATLAAAAAKAAEYGYDEINLNCGCPSDRVAGAGCFGAALMMQPQLVADCMAAMAAAVKAAAATAVEGRGSGGGLQQPAPPPLPLTVKCRLGVDEADSYAELHDFVRVVSEGSPVRHFVVHARKAFLNGLSPHQNRTVPPLRHQWAWALARDFPHLQFTLNGGLLGCHEARAAILTAHPEVPYSRPALPPSDPFAAAAAVCDAGAAVRHVQQETEEDGAAASRALGAGLGLGAAGCGVTPNGGGIEGVMIGRGAYNDPWGCLADADRAVYGEPYNAAPSRRWVIERYREYAEPMVGRWFVKADGHADPSIRTLMRPILNLFHGEPGCKRWKNAVDEVLKAGPDSFGEVLDRTLHLIPDHVLDAHPPQPDLSSLPPFQLDPVLPTPTSRAGQNQAPPGSKPPRKGGKDVKGNGTVGGKGSGKGEGDSGADGEEAAAAAATSASASAIDAVSVERGAGVASSTSPCCGASRPSEDVSGMDRTAEAAVPDDDDDVVQGGEPSPGSPEPVPACVGVGQTEQGYPRSPPAPRQLQREQGRQDEEGAEVQASASMRVGSLDGTGVGEVTRPSEAAETTAAPCQRRSVAAAEAGVQAQGEGASPPPLQQQQQQQQQQEFARQRQRGCVVS